MCVYVVGHAAVARPGHPGTAVGLHNSCQALLPCAIGVPDRSLTYAMSVSTTSIESS